MNSHDEELSSIQIIYPEADIDFEKRSCKIPIQVQKSIDVTLCNLSNEVTSVDYLPDICVLFKLPESYPLESPPNIEIRSSWITSESKAVLLDELYQIWSDFKDMVIFSDIDHLKTKIENELEELKIDIADIKLYEDILKFDKAAKRDAFNKETFTCEICCNDLKGSKCTRFPACNHTFCNSCLQDFFAHIINRGEVDLVHCPSYECTKKFDDERKSIKRLAESYKIDDWDSFDKRYFQLPLMVEILERIFVEKDEVKDDLIKKYLDLSHRNQMQKYQTWFPQRIASCPRELCSKLFVKRDIENKLTICPDCRFAFCKQCKHSWHGVNPCMLEMSMISDKALCEWIANNEDFYDQLSNDKKWDFKSYRSEDPEATLQNLALHYAKDMLDRLSRERIADLQLQNLVQSETSNIVQCPVCKCYIEKFDGCNKVQCRQCSTAFCFLCAQTLDNKDPYVHFLVGDCSGLLFEGMPGV